MTHLRAAWAQRIAATPSKLYHGTNVKLRPGGTLKPAAMSGQQVFDASYDFYDPYVVYLTTEDHLAERYALRAVIKLGGEPHVYEVRPIGVCYRDPEFEESGFGSDQWCATMGEIVREVPLPGLMRIQDDHLMRVPKTAGPGSGVIPWRVRNQEPISLRTPRPVVLDPIAVKDFQRIFPDEQKGVRRVIDLLEAGQAPLEPKTRELIGTFGIRIDSDCRLLVYPHIDGAWHVYYIGHHDYDEAERRMSAPKAAGVVE